VVEEKDRDFEGLILHADANSLATEPAGTRIDLETAKALNGDRGSVAGRH
jgi:hypothetical protein